MMKSLFVLIITLLITYCKREMNAAPTLVGQWAWVRSYNVGFEPSELNVNKGIFNFTSANTWTRSKNNLVVDSGSYTLYQSVAMDEDLINFYRTTPPPSYPILDSTYAYYSIQGDSLIIGALSSPTDPRIRIYGIVDVYARN